MDPDTDRKSKFFDDYKDQRMSEFNAKFEENKEQDQKKEKKTVKF